MTEKSETEMISRRRAFSILGLAALSMAMSPTVLTVSDSEAQQPTTTTGQNPQTGTTTTPKSGTETRQERRGERTERTTGRADRRQQRNGTTPPTSSTPQQH